MHGGQPNQGWRLGFPLWLHSGGSDFRLYDGSDLGAYLLMRFACWVSFAPVFGFVYCWVLIFALSPCCVLIYMFYERMH